MAPGTASAPNIAPRMGAVAGVNSSGVAIPRASYEYEVCYKCHSGPAAVSSQPGVVTRQIVQKDTRLQFQPNAVSFHPVQIAGRSDDVPSLIPTLTTASMIYCSDCHASDTSPAGGGTGPAGPHGSSFSPLLAAQYDRMDNATESAASYALCYKCHERSSILANQSFTSHSKHIVDKNTPCSICHDAHGISSAQGTATNHSRLINFDISVVQADPVTGRREFVQTGPRSGQCFLSCHGSAHSPKSYPAQ
jgi:hypothetical protein